MNRNIKFSIVDDSEGENRPSASENQARSETRPETRPIFRSVAGLRLIFLCLLLVMVIWAMNYSGRPESWDWLFQFDKVEPAAGSTANGDDESASGQFRSPGGRSPSESRAGEFAESDDATKGQFSGADPEEPVSIPGFSPSLDASAEQLESEFWTQTLKKLDGQEQIGLLRLVTVSSKQKQLATGETSTVSPVLSKVSRFRKQFYDRLKELGHNDAGFATNWNQSLLPAFKAVTLDAPDPALIDDHLRALPDIVQRSAEKLIKDNAQMTRPGEAYAWFAAWSDVLDQPVDQPTDNPASVTQLLAQPEAWRGDYIDVTGTALRVERVDASRNALGIERYYVVWIKPDHPSSFPWCVYSLMAPESLVGEPQEKFRIVNQRVETKARFFKNRLFDAGEAAYAPVLMTAAIDFPAASSVGEGSPAKIPGPNTIVLTLGIIGGLAVLVAWTVHRGTLGGGRRALPKEGRLKVAFSSLQQDQRVESTADKLKRLGDEARSRTDNPSDDSSDAPESDGIE